MKSEESHESDCTMVLACALLLRETGVTRSEGITRQKPDANNEYSDTIVQSTFLRTRPLIPVPFREEPG
jgi:hypothetical protein